MASDRGQARSRTQDRPRTDAGARRRARVRLANLAPRAGELLLSLDAHDADAAGGTFRLSPGTVTGALGFRFEDERDTPVNVVDPLDLPAGRYDLVVAAAGGEAVLHRETVRFGPASYTLAAFGTPDAIRVRTFRDKLGVLHPDAARLRVVNVAPDAPTLDAWVGGSDGSGRGGDPVDGDSDPADGDTSDDDGGDGLLAVDLRYGRGGRHVDRSAGPASIQLSVGRGAANDADCLDLPLAPDTVTTVFVVGDADGTEPLRPAVVVTDTYVPEGR